MNKQILIGLLLLSVFISLFFTIYRKDIVPPCFSSDEAAFGYNAYAILHTGRDEYGKFMPLQFKSFGEYKLPLYVYFSLPFIAAFDLNENAIRSLNIVLSLFFPIVMFFFSKELFKKDSLSIVTAFLTSFSLGLSLFSRQAIEVYLAIFLLTCTCYFFLKYIQKPNKVHVLLFLLTYTLALFSYRSIRIYCVFFLGFALYYSLRKSVKKTTIVLLIGIIAATCVLLVSDYIYKPSRINNLFILKDPGFIQVINQLRGEGGSSLFYNKVVMAGRYAVHQEFSYLSPQFLSVNGDTDNRFGYPGMPPITIVEYVFLFIGIYFLFRRKEKWRYFLLVLFFYAPLSASFSWVENSLPHALFILIPLYIISSYGMYYLFITVANNKRFFLLLFVVCLFTESIFLFFSWDYYFNHYAKRGSVIRSWECGYKRLSSYIKNNYTKYDTFYITKANGQPYIFLLFYLKYPPEKYQYVATLTSPDVYGFGQVEHFDKFDFNFTVDIEKKHTVFIGTPKDFLKYKNVLDLSKVKKITIGTEDPFWIYEN